MKARQGPGARLTKSAHLPIGYTALLQTLDLPLICSILANERVKCLARQRNVLVKFDAVCGTERASADADVNVINAREVTRNSNAHQASPRLGHLGFDEKTMHDTAVDEVTTKWPIQFLNFKTRNWSSTTMCSISSSFSLSLAHILTHT